MKLAGTLTAVVLLLISGPVLAQAPAPSASGLPSAPNLAIEKGSTVRIEYTLTDEVGTVLDTTKGRPPLTYTQGEQQIIPALERALVGMQPGQQKKIVVKPEDAYGTVDPEATAEVPKSMLPIDMQKVGAQLLARDSSGEARPVVVKEIKDSTIVLDLNHPLAGKTLHLDVKVIGVDAPKGSDAKPGN